MNELERKMVEQLQDLRENHHVIGVKAEFEAEGTRLEEAIRLKEVISAAGLGLTMKVGGCEALRDMYEARVIGVDRVVGPMVESAWAMHKYVQAVQMAFPAEERDEVQFCVNIETVTGVENFPSMLELPDVKELDGIVLGRVDMSGSMGLTRDDINSETVYGVAERLFAQAKARGLECALGGGVSADSLAFMRRLPEGHLDRYETRKVVFGCPGGLGESAGDGILKAVGFELMWLKNKRDFYGCIFEEDHSRIDMLQGRYDRLIEQAGGAIRMNGRTALVTGGSRGIGRAIVERLEGLGAHVISPTRAELDLRDGAAVDVYAASLATVPDILVNDAGVNPLADFADITDDVFDEVLSVNLSAPFRLCRALAPRMAARGYGRIVNVSSVWSLVAKPRRGVYAISKSGLNGLTRSLAVEYAAAGVLVNAVAPGFIATELTVQNNSPEEIAAVVADLPTARLGRPEEVAELIAFLCSRRNGYCTGQVIACDGGYTCL